MRLNRSNSRPAKLGSRHSTFESGVALVITVVMISIITFLAVAFLALTGRERGSVRTSVDQTTVRNATDVANARATAEIVANILATTNVANIDLLVSTNYISWVGFDPAAVNQLTNVNYDYDTALAALTPLQRMQNITNLLFNPRPPVFITNRVAGGYEFRYYLDLNRNGRFEQTGYVPVTNLNGTFYTTDGQTSAVFTAVNILSNHIVGDPQWIGGLDRPDKTHSADNPFLYRYAYIVVPEGKTLDVNYIHNQAYVFKRLASRLDANGRDYFRNQGVGTWEINLAAFLSDLNTNSTYGWGGYIYNPLDPSFPSLSSISGDGFFDAGAIYRYRLNGSPTNYSYSLPSFDALYNNNGLSLFFQNDQVDGYSDGPLQTTINYSGESFAANRDNTKKPWLGANQPFHLFSSQEFFDPSKMNRGGGGLKFTGRLNATSTNISTYDQTTFYRMLSQLGTDSAPEDDDKMNLNYVNVGGLKVTNFIAWTDTNAIRAALGNTVRASELFFTNAVERLLRKTTEEWFRAGPSNYLATFFGYYGYTNLDEMGLTNRPYFGMTNQVPTFGVNDIPVMWAGGNYVYSLNTNRTGARLFSYNQATHRILQLAANIWDTKTNSRALAGLPTVFRPKFGLVNSNLFVTGFDEETTSQQMAFNTANRPPLDIFAVTNLATRIPADGNILIYGVPPVVGARKGLPNFNEFQGEVLLTMTRKLQLRKVGNKITETNQLYSMSVTMPSAAEFWNSYKARYAQTPSPGVSVYVTNFATLVVKNDLGMNQTFNYTTGDQILGTNNWAGYTNGRLNSFVVMMRTNVPFITNRTYLPDRPTAFYPTSTPLYDTSQQWLMPQWELTISNRVQAVIADSAGRIIDYVLLGNMTYSTNWSAIFAKPTTVGSSDDILFDQLWATNAHPTASPRVQGVRGIQAQIEISLGSGGGTSMPDKWEDYLLNTSGDTVEAAIKKFNGYYYSSNSPAPFIVPFSPSAQYRIPLRWEANDPLVHYMSDDLTYVAKSGVVETIKPVVATTPIGELKGVGMLNERYKPWPNSGETVVDEGDTEAIDRFNPSMKDPLVTSSDDWNFPSNALPTVGWLGRVHRGTPWQTVYLKAANLGLGVYGNNMTNWMVYGDQSPQKRWADHAGSRTVEKSFYNRPVVDRVVFDVFTTALNDNSTRGQLPINQTGLAAWSAVFSGVIALNNVGNFAPAPVVIQPAGIFDHAQPNTWPPLLRIVNDINATRTNTIAFPEGAFKKLGDILSVPSLTFGDPVFVPDDINASYPQQGTYYWTNSSPYLNLGIISMSGRSDVVPTPQSTQIQSTLSDAAYEWLPQQVLSLLQIGKPRFTIYAYGQSLQPAPNSVVTVGGPFFGLCTNYAITAEQVTRTVVEIEGAPKAPRAVVKSYNILGPD